MPLLQEGTECWRPVQATPIADDVFKVVDQIPEGEIWAYAPFSRVRCRDKVFSDGRVGLAIFAYAIESNPYYPLLKKHQGRVFRIVFADGEEALVRVTNVDEEHEDFIYDVLSTNLESKYRGTPNRAVFAAKFAELISARLEE